MKFTLSNTLTVFLLFTNAPVSILAHPQPATDEIQILSREQAEQFDARDANAFGDADVSDLWKRKGGGGGGGRGGGSSSSGGKGGGSSSSSSGSSSSGRGSSSSSTGGQTKTGSGVKPSYGGGQYYGGGAKVPYSSGGRSPSGFTPFFLGAGALAFFPGIWLYGAYEYPYSHPYTFHNRTAKSNSTATSTSSSATATATQAARGLYALLNRQDDGETQTKNVTCICAAYAECGCDDNNNSTFLDSLIGDGTYANLNHTLVTVADINDTSMIIINGTLPNGTTASGGTENASAAARSIVMLSGYWVMVVLVGCTVFLG